MTLPTARKMRSTLLIIDSDPTTAQLLTTYVTAFGATIQSAHNGQQGEQMAAQSVPTLILMAQHLPDQDGLLLFQTIRKRNRTAHIPIMLLGDSENSEQQRAALAAGADDFVAKPFDAQLLALRIRNAITRAERDGLTHPRSGLPTGRLMTERVRALADEFDWCKVDFSIENFDPFTARYGFMSGDEVINFVANLITDVVRMFGRPEDFIGHRDDMQFSVITDSQHGPKIAETLESRFNKEVQSFYSFFERDLGNITVDHDNETRQYPLMTARIRVQLGDPE